MQFKTFPREGVFDAVASVTVNVSDLEDSTTFDCELKIPETNYTVKKSVILSPGEYHIYLFMVCLIPLSVTRLFKVD